mgnify:CR=1 FL=1
MFVLLLTFVLPHTGHVRGLDVLTNDPVARAAAIALPSRVFCWVTLLTVGFSMLALLSRRWVVAWLALAGSWLAGATGLLAVWSRQTASAGHPGPGLGLVIARLSGITTLGPWGVMAIFFGMVSGVTGVGVFAFGATFNYLVSLFYEQPIRQGVFGKPVFKKPLERNFGWMGAIALILGIVIAIISLVIGIGTDDILRMWFYLLGSALLILTGAQMVIYWLLMRVLAELSQRETRAQQDLEIH